MLYILHHSKGSLILTAGDRDQVRRWSERQLGCTAGLVSITEGNSMEAPGLVEKDGTGITGDDDSGCHPLMGVMAEFAQDVCMENGGFIGHTALSRGFQLNTGTATWH